jgi:hypothetical protein
MAGKTDTFENATLNVLRGNAPTPPAGLWLGCFSTMPADDGSGGVELSGGGYARQPITFSAPSAGQMANSGELLFGEASADYPKTVAVGLWDAASGGNLWEFDWLGTGQTWKPFTAEATGDIFTAPGHGFSNGHEVVLSAEIAGVLPTGVAAATLYYVIAAALDTFKLSLTLGGAAINLTVAGSGLVRRVIPQTPVIGDRLRFKAGTVVVVET